YLFSGSGCRAATTLPRAAAERLARTARFAGSLCAAGRVLLVAVRRVLPRLLNTYLPPVLLPSWEGLGVGSGAQCAQKVRSGLSLGPLLATRSAESIRGAV